MGKLGVEILEKARERVKITKEYISHGGPRTLPNYSYDYGWFYSENSRLSRAFRSDELPECLKAQGIKPPSGEVVVDYMGGEITNLMSRYKRKKLSEESCSLPNVFKLKSAHKCNAFVYDSIYSARARYSVRAPMHYVRGKHGGGGWHYYSPKGSLKEKGNFFEKEEIPFENVQPGDIGLFLGHVWIIQHMGIVVRRIDNKYCEIISTYPELEKNPIGVSSFNVKGNGLVFLRVVGA